MCKVEDGVRVVSMIDEALCDALSRLAPKVTQQSRKSSLPKLWHME